MSMHFNRILLALLVTVAAGHARSQYLWDVGIHAGGANYLGEMGGKEQTRRDFVLDLKLNQTRWTFGVFGRRMPGVPGDRDAAAGRGRAREVA